MVERQDPDNFTCFQTRERCTLEIAAYVFKLELEDLALILRKRRLCWFGYVERSSDAARTACDIQIDSRRVAGRPKLTWMKLTTIDPQERSTWRSGVRSAMHAASQLPGRGPLMWMMPLHLNQISDYGDYSTLKPDDKA